MGLQEIRDLLQRHGLRLQRERGQSFLVEDALAERLARLAGVEAGDHVIEVGTGLGVLTRALAARAARVTTIEIDAGLVRALREEGLLSANVELVHADALEIDLAALAAAAGEAVVAAGRGRVRLVANLPYSVASPMLRRLLDLRDRLADWSVMLQRELAARLVAAPGSRDYGSLTVLHALCADVSKELDLKPGCFFPPPAVVSSFLRIFPRPSSPLRPGELPRVERLLRAAFGQRRKTILNALRGGGQPWSGDRERLEAALAAAGIDPGARAETVEPERLLALARALPDAAPAA